MEDHPELECRAVFTDGTARIIPIGEIDLGSVALVAARLEDACAVGAHVVLDLCQTTFIDSAGLHLAVEWQERARRERFSFVLADVSAPVRRAIDVAGVGAMLTCVATT